MLARAMRYLGRYRWIAFLAYGSLFVATAAQLMVPQLVQSIIDTVVKAFAATQILGLPAAVQAAGRAENSARPSRSCKPIRRAQPPL